MVIKRILGGMLAAVTVVSMTGCGMAEGISNALETEEKNAGRAGIPPEEWYAETIKYYTEGYASNWANERSDLPFTAEMKDKNNKFGYLIRDLDGDGIKEFLIGYADDKKETRFTELYIWHSDFGVRRTFTCGDGHYMYLCDNGLIKSDTYSGSGTEYMKYDSAINGMHVLENEQGTPQKVELTPF